MNQTLTPELDAPVSQDLESIPVAAERPMPFAAAFTLLAERQQQADEARERLKAEAWKTYSALLAVSAEADPKFVAEVVLILELTSDEVKRHLTMVARYRDSQKLADKYDALVAASLEASDKFKRLRSELPRAVDAAEAEADRARRRAGDASRAANTLSQLKRELPHLADGGLFALLDQQHATAVAEATSAET